MLYLLRALSALTVTCSVLGHGPEKDHLKRVLPARLRGMLGKTELETRNFAVDKPFHPMSQREAEVAVKMLARPHFDVLGDWRTNKTIILEINNVMVNGGYFLLDNFLKPHIADQLYKDMVLLGERGYYLRDGYKPHPWNQSGVDNDAWQASFHDPMERCRLMSRDFGVEFMSWYHDYHFISEGLPKPKEDFPALIAVLEALNHRNWDLMNNLLLAGTGFRVYGAHPSRVQCGATGFRDWQVGDYTMIHDDRANHRIISMVYFLFTQPWQSEWGGNFLWCGELRNGLYHKATRLPGSFNQMVYLVPHVTHSHGVEPVQPSLPRNHHRFTFTEFLLLDATEEVMEKHYEVSSDVMRGESEL